MRLRASVFRIPVHREKLKSRCLHIGIQLSLAGEQGFEPQLKASKASVLPLDDSPRLAVRCQDTGFRFKFLLYMKNTLLYRRVFFEIAPKL